MKRIRRTVTVIYATIVIGCGISALVFGYCWWIEDAGSPEPKYGFFTAVALFLPTLVGLIRELMGTDEDDQLKEEETNKLRILCADVDKKLRFELKNLAQLKNGRQNGTRFQGTHLKAVAEYSFTEVRDAIVLLPKTNQFQSLVAALNKEIETQLAIDDKNARQAEKTIELVGQLRDKLKPLVPSEAELAHMKTK